jgi:hypothetical protein
MGKLVDAQCQTGSIISSDKKGIYDRKPRAFRSKLNIAPTMKNYSPGILAAKF